MNDRYVTEKLLEDFSSQLRAAGCAQGTAENYLLHVRAFARWLEGGEATGEAAAGWRCWLLGQGYGPPSVNGMLVALNRFFKFAGWDCRAELLRIQRRAFRDRGRELTRGEYERLVKAARGQGRGRLALVMETICATGIRVSELRYVTVEAARRGQAEIALKGKIRTILISARLRRKLLDYARKTNRLRRDIPHQKRQEPGAKTDMGGDEGGLQVGARRAGEGVPAQPAAPVRARFLPRVPRYRKTGGRAGPFQHRYCQDLSCGQRRGARPGARPAAIGDIGQYT